MVQDVLGPQHADHAGLQVKYLLSTHILLAHLTLEAAGAWREAGALPVLKE